MKKAVSFSVVCCMLLMLFCGSAVAVFAEGEEETPAASVFDPISALTTTSELPEGVTEGIEFDGGQIGTDGDNNPIYATTATLRNIKNGSFTYNYDLGAESANGIELTIGTPNEAVGFKIKVYKVVPEGENVLLGTATHVSAWRYQAYNSEFVPFSEALTGTGSIIIEFDNSGTVLQEVTVDNPSGEEGAEPTVTYVPIGWLDFTSFAFVDASKTVDAWADIVPSEDQIINKGTWLDNAQYPWFGDTTEGDWVLTPNVNFGDKTANVISFYIGSQGRNSVTDQSKVEVRLGGSDGELILEMTGAELHELTAGMSRTNVMLEKPVEGGVHHIYVRTCGYSITFANFHFRSDDTKDGTQRIMAVDYDNDYVDMGHRPGEDNVAETVGHFGHNDGERLYYLNVDLGEASMDAMNIRFSAWQESEAGTTAVTGGGKLEVYAGGELVGTVPYVELSQNIQSYATYAVPLTKTLTGKFSVTIVSYWTGALAWFEFTDDTKYGFERIKAVDHSYFSFDGAYRDNEDGMEQTVGWLGHKDGERIPYNLIDFGDSVTNTMKIRFNAWSDGTADAQSGTGKIEVYANGALVGTVPFAEMSQHIDQFTTYEVQLEEPLTGLVNINIVSYWMGAMSWLEFIPEGLVTYAPTADTTTGAVSVTAFGKTDAENVKVVFAAYDADGRMIGFADAASATAAEVLERKALSASFGKAIPEGATVKAFVWNSVEKLEPLAAPADII